MSCDWIGYILGPAMVFGGIGSVVRLWWAKRKSKCI